MESEKVMQKEIGDKQIGVIINKYRLAHRITQEQLGELVGCSPGFVGQVERGESMPSVHILRKIIQALDMDANELFWETVKASAEDEHLANQIHHYINHMSTNEKYFILAVVSQMNILK